MNVLSKMKLLLVGLFIATTAAYACPNGCDINKTCPKMQNGAMCDKKTCECKCDACKNGMCGLKGQAQGCELKGAMCPKEGKCNTPMPNKGGMCHKKRDPFVQTVLYAMKHVGLNKDDWGDVRLAIATYRKTCQSTPRGISPKALVNGTFDKALFIKECTAKMAQKTEAKAELIEMVMLLLDEKQKKEFTKLVAAHQHTMELKREACQKQKCDTPKSMMPNGTMCDKK